MFDKKIETFDKTQKVFFLFGFVAGIALISLGMFIGLFSLMYSSDGFAFAGRQNGTNLAAVQPAAVPTPESYDSPTAIPEPSGDLIAIKDGEYIRGNKDAAIEIIEYSDFECPYCQKFTPTVDKILSTYGDQVKFVYRHFPLSFHPSAQGAAEASECAGEQGKFWEMHDALFIAGNEKALTKDRYIADATNLGLDINKFTECFNNDKYSAKIQNDIAEGTAAGVTGTPATFIGGRIISGALPFEQVKPIIESLLKE